MSKTMSNSTPTVEPRPVDLPVIPQSSERPLPEPAGGATRSLLPPRRASVNCTPVTQYVPVKTVVDTRGAVLPLGTSAGVRQAVRRPAAA
jgi:hypothetical protein